MPTLGAPKTRLAYMSRWSSLCAGRWLLSASKRARSTGLTRPLVPGGSTSRKPATPLAPNGSGVGAAAAGPAANASRAIPAATMDVARSTSGVLPGRERRAQYRVAEWLCAGSGAFALVVELRAHAEFVQRLVGGFERGAVANRAGEHGRGGDRGTRLDVDGQRTQ